MGLLEMREMVARIEREGEPLPNAYWVHPDDLAALRSGLVSKAVDDYGFFGATVCGVALFENSATPRGSLVPVPDDALRTMGRL